jgi:hypothetical protein
MDCISTGSWRIAILTNSDNADAYGIAFGVSGLLQNEDKKN